MSVTVEWVGLACFRLSREGGNVIVTDPYDPKILADASKVETELFEAPLQGDTVICSSFTDQAHGFHERVNGKKEAINALDVATGKQGATINGESIITVQAAEALHHPKGPEDNALYAMKFDDLWILHMGDLGYGIFEDALAPFNDRCDILLALTGEGLTLSLDDLDRMINILKPRWIVPMHYNLPPLAPAGMSTVDAFLRRRAADPIIHLRHHTAVFPQPELAVGRPTIVVLKPSGYEQTGSFL